MVFNDPLLLPIGKPPVPRNPGIMLVDLAVALAPVEKLTSAKTLFLLLQCLVNARNFEDQGINTVKKLSQKVSAYQLVYSDIEQATEWIQKTITA